MATKEPSLAQDYFDYVLLGKTGMGKSTTGNKLLGIYENNRDSYTMAEHNSSIPNLLKSSEEDTFVVVSETATKIQPHAPHPLQFKEGGSMHSTTKKCQLISNDSQGIRVLDVPGFSDSEAARNSGGTVFTRNLALVRNLVRIQMDKDLKIRCVLYFLPVRGPLEKSDGVQQEEINVMLYYFGSKILDHMVLVATITADMEQSCIENPGINPFSEKSKTRTNEAFRTAVTLASGIELKESPPIVCIRSSDTGQHIRDMLTQALQLEKKPKTHSELKINESVCSKCAIKLVFVSGSKYCVNPAGEDEPQSQISTVTKCHSQFIPKHSKITKVVGGVAHILTAGLPYMFMEKSPWPGFFNNEEKCIHCEKEPGSRGCCEIGSKDKNGVTVEHTNKVGKCLVVARSN